MRIEKIVDNSPRWYRVPRLTELTEEQTVNPDAGTSRDDPRQQHAEDEHKKRKEDSGRQIDVQV